MRSSRKVKSCRSMSMHAANARLFFQNVSGRTACVRFTRSLHLGEAEKLWLASPRSRHGSQRKPLGPRSGDSPRAATSRPPSIPHPTPYHTIPYHTTTPHHTIPYHTIPYHTIPYYTTPYHTIPHHTTPYYTIPFHTTPLYCTTTALKS